MSNLFEYLAIPTGSRRHRPRSPAPPSRPEEGIRFEDVGFRYPGAEGWALRDVDLFIPRGQSLALVGQNGAGKTTFIKLLTRLYEPTEGRILLDGRDLARPGTRRRCAGASASSSRTSTSTSSGCARTSASAASSTREDDPRARARRRAAAAPTRCVAALPAGLETPARPLVQGRRRALRRPVAEGRAGPRLHARGGRHPGPRRAHRRARRRGRARRLRALPALAQGRTTILISHRFPTVRMADRIVVLEGGQHRRAGHPRGAGRADGRYAHLFALQAKGYQ